MVNNTLKAKIIERYGSQYEFARVVGTFAPYVSMVIRHRRKLSADDQRKWTEALGCKPADIFED